MIVAAAIATAAIPTSAIAIRTAARDRDIYDALVGRSIIHCRRPVVIAGRTKGRIDGCGLRSSADRRNRFRRRRSKIAVQRARRDRSDSLDSSGVSLRLSTRRG
ncbi:hypothetical protein EA472_18185 [Natrarchaeobius oligotrophus]|uniref:Uncharacterized protein n=1 Tax=Natrarchaeobius chitinivorans TaxID=1679083 RepID=A0A3N6PET1_NATCH|nr:hypothetical protein EA472_18185 [Natrarchaeobius chitinivorans]